MESFLLRPSPIFFVVSLLFTAFIADSETVYGASSSSVSKDDDLKRSMRALLIKESKDLGVLQPELINLDENTIPIAVMQPYSIRKKGSVELYTAAEIAASEINSSGGINGKKLVIIKIDSEEGSLKSENILREAISRYGIRALIGPLSSQHAEHLANTVTIPQQLPMLLPAANADSLSHLKDNDLLFRLTATNSQIVEKAAMFIKEQEYKKVAVLYQSDIFGTELAKGLETKLQTSNAKIVYSLGLDFDIDYRKRSFAEEVKTMEKLGVDIVFLPVSPEQSEALFSYWPKISAQNDSNKAKKLPTFLYAEHAQRNVESKLFTKGQEICVYSVVPDLGFMDLSLINGIEKTLETTNTSYTALFVYDFVYFSAAAIEMAESNNLSFSQALRAITNENGQTVDAYSWPNLSFLIKNKVPLKFSGSTGEALFDSNGDNLKVKLMIKEFHKQYGEGCYR